MARARKLLNLLIAFVIIIFLSSLLFLHVVVATVVAAAVVAADDHVDKANSILVQKKKILSNFLPNYIFGKSYFIIFILISRINEPKAKVLQVNT
jgi:hypothetical protein